jgi:hypothetical protein
VAKQKRDYKREAAIETDARREARAQRLRARRLMIKKGEAARFDGKDVGHKTAISKGGTNAVSNLEMQDPHANRSFKRNSKRGLVSETSTKERKARRK